MTIATYLYISPHLDDAVLSVGGLIAAQLAAGDRVVIATVCTADPAIDGIFSPLAIGYKANLQEWNFHQRIAARRGNRHGGNDLGHMGLNQAPPSLT